MTLFTQNIFTGCRVKNQVGTFFLSRMSVFYKMGRFWDTLDPVLDGKIRRIYYAIDRDSLIFEGFYAQDYNN